LAGVKWIINEKEVVNSGVVKMYTVRVGFFLELLYRLSCRACYIWNASMYGKTEEQVCRTADPVFGEDLYGKNLIINKSLYVENVFTEQQDSMTIWYSHF
jgi:hypothetical protein